MNLQLRAYVRLNLGEDMFTKQPMHTAVEQAKRKPRRRLLIIVGLVLAVALTGAGTWWFGVGLPAHQGEQQAAMARAAEEAAAKKKAEESAAFWAQVDKENKESWAEDEANRKAFNSSQEQNQAASVKTQMEAQGWTQFSGHYYYQYADKSEYTCSYSRCLVVHVTTMAPAGCSRGLYVEATVDAGGASVGRANSITAALPQGKDAIVKLTDTSGMGETMGITDLHCLGE